MSIKNKKAAALEALQNTLLVCPHIEKVYFTRAGEHYFNMHELEVKGKATGKLYGYQKVKAEIAKVVGERRIYKHVSVATPESEIVQTLSRDEVLDYEFKEPAADKKEKPGKPGKPAADKKEEEQQPGEDKK